MANSIIIDESAIDEVIEAVDRKIVEEVARSNAKEALRELMPLLRKRVAEEAILHDDKWRQNLN